MTLRLTNATRCLVVLGLGLVLVACGSGSDDDGDATAVTETSAVSEEEPTESSLVPETTAPTPSATTETIAATTVPATTAPATTGPATTAPPTTVPTTTAAEPASAETTAPTDDVGSAEGGLTPGPDSETIETEGGEVLAYHAFGGDTIDGPDCVPGFYDVEDDDVQLWYEYFSGGISMSEGVDFAVTVDPGSGGLYSFEDDGGFTLELLVVGTMDIEGDAAAISTSGIVNGRWTATDVLTITYESADVTASSTFSGITMDLPLGPEIVAATGTLELEYECYDTGVLSLQWPTSTPAGAPIIDLVRRFS